jgi:hypothetical protein
MFWQRYRGVVWTLLVTGAVVGGALLLALILVVPPDPWQGVGMVLLYVLWGAVLGAVTALAAAGMLALVLGLWTRRRARSVASRAWAAVIGAAAGAIVLWLVVGFASWLLGADGASALLFSTVTAVVSGILAGITAAPATVRAARRADARGA